MRDLLLENPYWGLLLTVGCYWLGVRLQVKTGWSFLPPVLVASVSIIFILQTLDVDFETYNLQNAWLNYLLPLTAVVLSVPLYRNLKLLKHYGIPVCLGIFSGTAVTMGVLILAGKLMGTDSALLLSMIPKSATNPIAIEVSELIGGIPSFTVAMVVMTGTFGAVAGPQLLKLLGVTHPVAQGTALGAMTHAVGTSRAFQEGEIQGTMSSLSMALAGMLTGFLAPFFAAVFF